MGGLFSRLSSKRRLRVKLVLRKEHYMSQQSARVELTRTSTSVRNLQRGNAGAMRDFPAVKIRLRIEAAVTGDLHAHHNKRRTSASQKRTIFPRMLREEDLRKKSAPAGALFGDANVFFRDTLDATRLLKLAAPIPTCRPAYRRETHPERSAAA